MPAKDADKRTEIEWQRYDDRATVFSDEEAIVRRLLRHPLFESEQVLESDGEPIAVQGNFPVAAVRLGTFQRYNKGHARVLPFDTERRWADSERNTTEEGHEPV